MNQNKGTLYGIGVGPGDPELITIKAVNVLKRVDVVFAASSSKNHHSLAMRIAGPHIPESTPVRKLGFPMTTDKTVTQKAWQQHAETIHDALEAGLSAAFLTLGDPMTYSTYGYVLQCLHRIDATIAAVTIPGITSYQAGAARLNIPLVEGEEALLVVSGAMGGDRLRQLTIKPENVVFLKAYRNVTDIAGAIDEVAPTYRCLGISKCGQAGEKILPDLESLKNQDPDYWTLIIAKQKK